MGLPMRKSDDYFDLLDPKLLSLFDLIYSTGSVTRAGAQLGQSQPTVSIWLSKLRLELRDPLFIRTPKGMLPTPRADDLIGPVREALISLRRISQVQAEFDPASAQRAFHLCMTDAGDITMLPRILRQVMELAPGITLQASRIDSNTGSRLASGELDLALGLVPELDTGFYQQVLYEESWVCLCSADHPRLGNLQSIEDYKKEAHIAFSTRTGLALESNLQRQRIERKVTLELPGFLGLPAILDHSGLIATLPSGIGEALARTTNLKAFACPVKLPSFAIKQYWHERYQHDLANRWLRTVCASLFAGVSK